MLNGLFPDLIMNDTILSFTYGGINFYMMRTGGIDIDKTNRSTWYRV